MSINPRTRKRRVVTGLSLLTLLVLGGCTGKGQQSGPSPDQKRPSTYLGRDIADVMSSEHGASWLDRPGRKTEELPQRLIRVLKLKPAETVADIGAGTGYISFLLSREVPHGRVLAVDVQEALLDTIRVKMNREEITNVIPILGSETNPNLPTGIVDLALIVSSYHEFSDPKSMLDHIYDALRPGGRLVIVEYREEDPTIPVPDTHRMSEGQIRLETEASGFRWRESLTVLPQQHVVVLEKPVQ